MRRTCERPGLRRQGIRPMSDSSDRLIGFTREPEGHYIAQRPLTGDEIIQAGNLLTRRSEDFCDARN